MASKPAASQRASRIVNGREDGKEHGERKTALRVSVKIAERLQRVRSYGERQIPLGPGVVWFSNPDLGTGICFPIQKLAYRVRLSGPTGAVEALLSFVNPTTQPQQAYFLFPLDREVTPVVLRGKHGSHQIEIEVSPNPQDSPEESLREGLPVPLARLFQNETERVLAISLGEVAPGGQVDFQILYACFVSESGEEGRGFSFRLPLMASRALTTLDPDQVEQTALAIGLERGAQVAVSILIEASDLQPGRISTSQVCGVAPQANGDLAIEYDRSKQLEARDFVVDYHLWTGPRPKAWLRSQGRHFLLNFLPPEGETPSLPRRIVFLVDGSEEMNKIGAHRCHACISGVLKGLGPQDSFALVTFNRDVAGFKSGDFVETRLADEALAWLREYKFGGVADLKALLERVVKLPKQPDSVLSIVLVTAGRLGNEPELYRLLQGSRENLRFFPIILGRKADPHFARAAAKATGGRAFRALSEESVSRVCERLLEETRQPVLEIVGIQDRGLGFQGDSLTPKYPSGLSSRRPINILGLHTGKGGVEAGGKSSHGVSWSEQVEPKEIFHKVLHVIWAMVKAGELDDEARMLDRAEKSILRNVVRNLSEEYFLTNSHTAAIIKDNSGQDPRFAAQFEPWRWLKIVEKSDENAKSANELLEEQKSQKGIKGGRSLGSTRGGLKMKDTLGKSATVFGSKLGHQNRLSGSVKDGIFNKPMLGGGTATTTIEPSLPQPEPVSPAASVGSHQHGGTAVLPPLPPVPPTISAPPTISTAPAEPSTPDRPVRPVALRPSEPSSVPTGFQRPTTIPPSTSPPPAKPALPTPRDLAAKVTAEARSGAPEVVAKEALKRDPELRQALMNQMRQLHAALGTSQDPEQLGELTDVVLLRLAQVAPYSELLVRAYGLGYQGRGLLTENLDEAKEKLKFWLTRFAKLF